MHILLAGNNISWEGAPSIAVILCSCDLLEHLNISFNELQDEGIIIISEALSTTKSRLKQLDLASNYFECGGAKALSNAVRKCTMLETLDIEENPIGDTGAGWMASAVRWCKTIKFLRMAETRISIVGVEKLAKASTKTRKVTFTVGGDHRAPSPTVQRELSRFWAGTCIFEWKQHFWM